MLPVLRLTAYVGKRQLSLGMSVFSALFSHLWPLAWSVVHVVRPT